MAPKSSIPAWQRSTSVPGAEDFIKPEEPASPAQSETAAEAPVEHPIEIVDDDEASSPEPELKPKTLREQAAKFLQDPSIREADRARKVAFLESKGVQRVDIEALLGKDTEHVAAQVCLRANQITVEVSYFV
jgi:hypothetical protein